MCVLSSFAKERLSEVFSSKHNSSFQLRRGLGVGHQSGEGVDQEVEGTAVPRMLELADILKLVIITISDLT